MKRQARWLFTFITLLLGALLLYAHAKPAYAVEGIVEPDLGKAIQQGGWSAATSNPTFAEFLAGGTVVGWSFGYKNAGIILSNDTSKTLMMDDFQKSAFGGLTSTALAMYTQPPANLALWMHQTGQDLGFIPRQAYAQGAQGIGFSGLTGLLPIWTVFRNVAYFLLAAAMVIIGFMVMFRQKIDPKTVVTVQNALPRIVITLILITFSYAIVGLMIDCMYLVLLLVTGLLKSAGNNIQPGLFGADVPGTFVTNGGFQLFNWVYGGGFKALDDLLALMNPTYFKFASGGIPSTTNVGTAVSQGIMVGLSLFMTGATSILLIIGLTVILLFTLVRIFFMLGAAYIQIIIAVVFAPLQILLDAFPGGDGFASWFKNLAANLLVFPVTAALLMLTYILDVSTMSGLNNVQNAAKIWSPPIMFPGGQYGLGGVIGVGMLLGIPKIVGSIKETLKAKPAMQMGLNVGSASGSIMQLLSGFYYAKSLAPGLFGRVLPQQESGGGAQHH